MGKTTVKLTLSVDGPVRQVAYDPAPGVRVFVVAGLPPGQSGVGGDGCGERKKDNCYQTLFGKNSLVIALFLKRARDLTTAHVGRKGGTGHLINFSLRRMEKKCNHVCIKEPSFRHR